MTHAITHEQKRHDAYFSDSFSFWAQQKIKQKSLRILIKKLKINWRGERVLRTKSVCHRCVHSMCSANQVSARHWQSLVKDSGGQEVFKATDLYRREWQQTLPSFINKSLPLTSPYMYAFCHEHGSILKLLNTGPMKLLTPTSTPTLAFSAHIYIRNVYTPCIPTVDAVFFLFF